MYWKVISVKRLFFIIPLFCVSNLVIAQQEGLYTKINQTVSPAPTAASLGAYGNYEVGYTGVPAISVPLLEVQIKDFRLPITLNYNAGGIKVEDISGWVGTGWSLDAGGVVTRSVVDVPDDNDAGESNLGGTGFLYQNWFLPGYNPTGNGFSDRIDPTPGATAPATIAGILGFMRGYGEDTEPDIFYYNFNGRSGKFVFDSGFSALNRKVLLIPYQDLKIDFNANPTTIQPFGLINQFIITDERGNKYYFDSTETTITYTYGSVSMCETCTTNTTTPGSDDGSVTGTSYENTMNYRSSWFISKIVTSNNDTIRFSYVSESYRYEVPNSITATLTNPANPSSINMIALSDAQGCLLNSSNPPTSNDFGTTYAQTFTYITGERLTNITGPNFRIEFDANHARQDIYNDSALTSVKLFSTGNNGLSQTLVKQFKLGYSYIADLSKPQLQQFTYDPGNYGDSRMHLMLDTVYNIDANGNILSNYNFQYNNSTPLPDRLSNQKDFWGYYCNNGCNNGFPKLYVYTIGFPTNSQGIQYNRYSVFPETNYEGQMYILPGANRNTNPASILSGSLSSIQFPTGGYTNFIFEPHTFIYNGQSFSGGGLRLKQLSSFDGINHINDVVHNYSYVNTSDNITSSGVLFNLPVFAYGENAFKVYNSYVPDINSNPPVAPIRSPNDSTYYKYNVVRSDVSQASLNGFDGVNVGYREITDSQTNNGKVVKRFSVPGAYGVTSDYTVDGCDINQSGFCDGYFQAPVPINIDNYLPSETGSVGPGNWGTPVSIDLEGTDVNTPYTFPFAPSPNYDWNRGLVLSESYFNNTGSLVKLTDFQYQLFTPQNLGVKYVNGLKKGRLLNYAMTVNGGGSPAYSAGIPRYDVIAAYQILAQVCKVPLYKTTYYYDQVSGKTVQDSIIYNYQYNNMLPTSQVHYESDGSTTTQYTKYITDIDTSQTTAIMTMQGYYNMLRNHKVYDIVERYTQVSRAGNAATTISGNFITYKPSMAKPDSSFRIKSSLPLTNFSPSTTLYNSYIKDSRYEALTLFDQYDAEENILQQHKIYDEDHSYIWDYGNSYSVAEVSNASPSNIAYTSFEADGGGNWTIPDTTRNRTVSITGNISYSLKSSNTITKSGLNSSTNYIVSYWSQNGPLTISNGTTGLAGITLGIWTYYEHQVSGAGSVSVSGTAVIDELRLYPKGALMSTYTYIPMVGMTTHCDESNRIAYYIYDAFGRLKLIKDQYGNILKRYDYEYQTTNQ